MEKVALPLLGIRGLLIDGCNSLESNGRIPLAVTTRLLAFQTHFGSLDLGTCRSEILDRVIDLCPKRGLTFDMTVSTALAAIWSTSVTYQQGELVGI